jgi:RimJ/RimL family protein N-acetyltransferase
MLNGRNCLLKILEDPDWRPAYEVFAQPHVWPWIVSDPARVLPSEFANVLSERLPGMDCRLFGIWTEQLVGFCGISIDWKSRCAVAAPLGISGQKRGFPVVAMEAVRLLTSHVFTDLGLNRFESHVTAANKPMQAIYRRLGATQEAVCREKVWHAGSFHDQCIYAMLRSEYLALMDRSRHVQRRPERTPAVASAGKTSPEAVLDA